ncbi:MAG TPA: O-antigen ligase family protein [Puia sp.]|nr:O-antigen ligase family protein [Puia sp.]
MKKVFYIKDSIENRISYYHLLFFLVALPFDRLYSTLILISFILHSAIYFDLKRIGKVDKVTFIPQLVFFVTMISAIYSPSSSKSLAVLGNQMAILIFPLLFTLTTLDLAKYRSWLMEGLTMSCTLTIVYLYFDAFHTIFYYKLPVWKLFSLAFVNQNFSEPLDMHPTYLSMLIVLSIVYSLSKIMQKSGKNVYYLGSCFILFAGLIQLGSKSALLSLMIIIIFGIPWFLINQKYRLRFLLYSLFVSVLLISGIFSLQGFRNRFIVTLQNDLTNSKGAVSMNGRLDRWKVAADLIKKSPFLGTGSGSEIPLLRESYFERKMYGPYIFSLNAHNQYLSFLITSGVVGLLIYLGTLGWGLRHSIRNKDVLLFSFIVLTIIVSFSEDLLDVNKGIFFYAFFYSFFIRSESILNS